MIRIDCIYNIKNDIDFLIEAEKINNNDFAEKTKISRTTLDVIDKKGSARNDVCEKVYSYIYACNYRINSIKEELIREKYKNVLFHGSKFGLKDISPTGSRGNCDFGKGFYLGETYNQALSFICENEKSSVYSFRYSIEDLNVIKFDCDLDWMLTICYYRGMIDTYASNPIIKKLIKKVEKADIIIAPIADNKMFYIMSQFVEGEINADVAIHSLSASSLGSQYVFKTEKAINKLIPIEKYYISGLERMDCRRTLNERSYEIDTKLKYAKREFKDGLYIEEILK